MSRVLTDPATASAEREAEHLGYSRAVNLPFQPPIEPMLAKLTDEIPTGPGWQYEPKWDGFRAIVFRDGDEFFIQSRDLKPLDRYFPELPPALRANLPDRASSTGRSSSPDRTGSTSTRCCCASTRRPRG
jgi:ATP-dependent DNA ligase